MLSFNGPRGRGLLTAGVLGALLVAAPTAGAANFGGGTVDLNLSGKFVKRSGKISPTFPAERDGSRGVSLGIAREGGDATLNARPSGTLNAEERAGFELKRGKRELSLDNCTVALTGKVARLRCDGTNLFQGPLAGDRIEPDVPQYTKLSGRTPVRVTKAGARVINRKLKTKLRKGQRAGSVSVDAERLLTVVSGNSQTFYDQAFIDALAACDVSLLTLAPATPIPAGPNAPRGGVDLPQRAGGTLNAVEFQGSISHDGGNQLNRPASSPRGAYESNLINYTFELGSTANLLADVPKLNLTQFNIGSVNGGQFATNLTDSGGSVTFNGAELVLSQLASGTLAGETGCNIPAGSKIGTVQATSNVE